VVDEVLAGPTPSRSSLICMDRSARAEPQARRRLELLAEKLAQAPVAAVVARRGSCRFFLATAAVAHERRLALALQAFDRSPWAAHTHLVC
jgi:hypothetical protein